MIARRYCRNDVAARRVTSRTGAAKQIDERHVKRVMCACVVRKRGRCLSTANFHPSDDFRFDDRIERSMRDRNSDGHFQNRSSLRVHNERCYVYEYKYLRFVDVGSMAFKERKCFV